MPLLKLHCFVEELHFNLDINSKHIFQLNIYFSLCFPSVSSSSSVVSPRCLLFCERYTAPAGAAISQPVPVSVWGHPADVGPECQQQSSLPGGIQLPDQRGPGDPAQPAQREQLPGSVTKERQSCTS